MADRTNKGVILFMVIGVILVVVLFTGAMLKIISSQSRLTHHQVSRIQAQYAAKAAVLFALDKLRRNDDVACWPAVGTYTRRMQRAGAGCDIIEPSLPISIQWIDVVVGLPGSGVSGTRQVSATAEYTYP